uniref:Alpha-1,2-Mannosidase n=1 Tax=Rhabditophanes sp. KR3021 TaxID=114890 RepID=A0AC35UFL3_9BILA
MKPRLFCVFIIYLFITVQFTNAKVDKVALKNEVKEMFTHGFQSYMKYAFPDDELMPLTCGGRRRQDSNRGTIDDALGNFSLTLIDSLDSLIVFSQFDEFESAVEKVIKTVTLDSDFDVSVFEVTIRVVGGLVSGHIMAGVLKNHDSTRMQWYDKQLLDMAEDVAKRLLPAFNTSGLPYSKVNLKRGITPTIKLLKNTCTACAGTMILEFTALSRLTSNDVYEKAAKKTMDFLWAQRNLESDLMGTTLEIHHGEWIRKDSGIGAGLDSYFEYLFKTYLLFGDEQYLQRFNKHYKAIMTQINKGPLYIDIDMRTGSSVKGWMDSLSAFWPTIQVLKGDLKAAIEMHELYNLVMKRHKMIPEAFTFDMNIHWGQSLIRPEMIESTYFLYKATKDEHYLEVAEMLVKNINKYHRVKCGYASIKDVRNINVHEDSMESFFLAETVKYLYMIFAEPGDMIFDPDVYVLTTEAHFLPLTMGINSDKPRKIFLDRDEVMNDDLHTDYSKICPYYDDEFKNAENLTDYGRKIRAETGVFMSRIVSSSGNDDNCNIQQPRIRAKDFLLNNKDHTSELLSMGITLEIDANGHIKFTHTPNTAKCVLKRTYGIEFMNEIASLYSRVIELDNVANSTQWRTLQILSGSAYGGKQASFLGGFAHFGDDFSFLKHVTANVITVQPYEGCVEYENNETVRDKIAIVKRGICSFHTKAKFAQKAGAVSLIIVDNNDNSSFDTGYAFAMAKDVENTNEEKVIIPVIFLFHAEATKLLVEYSKNKNIVVRLGNRFSNPIHVFTNYLNGFKKQCE